MRVHDGLAPGADLLPRTLARTRRDGGGADLHRSPDSEGTLGGLGVPGRAGDAGAALDQALDDMRLCASDPLCAEHHPYRDGITLHAASCHACLFAPETSCERGNKYLDRAVLVPTVERSDIVFFEPPHERRVTRHGAGGLHVGEPPALHHRADCGRRARPGPDTDRARHTDSAVTACADGGVSGGDRRRFSTAGSGRAQIAAPTAACALLTAAHALQASRQAQTVEMVWTGPAMPAVTLRQTEQALLDVVQAATARLTVVSYAIYRIPRLQDALVAAAHRGVHLRVIVETPTPARASRRMTRSAPWVRGSHLWRRCTTGRTLAVPTVRRVIRGCCMSNVWWRTEITCSSPVPI